MYRDNTATIKLEREGKAFAVHKGVRQGDPLSPDIFNCVLQSIFQKLNWDEEGKGLKMNGKCLNNLRFADDIVILAYPAKELQHLLNELNTSCK